MTTLRGFAVTAGFLVAAMCLLGSCAKTEAQPPGGAHSNAPGGTAADAGDGPALLDIPDLAERAEFAGADGLRAQWAVLAMPFGDRLSDWECELDGAAGTLACRGGDARIIEFVTSDDRAGARLATAVIGEEVGVHSAWSTLEDGDWLCGCQVFDAEATAHVLVAAAATEAAAQDALCGARSLIPVLLPEALGAARKTETVTYDAKTIFDYIDGAAETHLRYGFTDMTRGVYVEGDRQFAVEVYNVRTPADAFGLYSRKASGDPVEEIENTRLAGGRTLYAWRGPYYIEVKPLWRGDPDPEFMVEHAQAALLTLGPTGHPADLVESLAPLAESLDRIRYFHGVQDQSDVLYLSTANVLRLGATTEGAMVRVGEETRPTVALVVRYGPDADVGAIRGEFLAAISLTADPVAEAAPYEWDPGRWVYVAPAADTPEGLLVGAFDAPSADEAERVAKEALACVH